MKKIILYTSIVLMAWFMPSACIDDKTTTAFRAGSPIEISVQDTIVYQDFGLPVIIEPEITQALPDLPLKYEWRCIATDGSEGSDSLRFISTEKVLNYKFPRAGVFRLRLRVENQFGSSFLYFRVNIQAPFEQGLLLLSNDEQDNSRLSFLRLKEEDELLEKENTDFNLNAFGQANSDVILHGARDVIFTRTGKYSNNYVLAISSEPEQKIYFLNGRYFLIENIADVKMLLPEAYPTLLCGNGDGINKRIMFGTNDKAGHPGDYGFINLESILVFPGDPSGMYDKIFSGEVQESTGRPYIGCFIDNTNSNIICYQRGWYLFTCGERFVGKQVINGVFVDRDMFLITAEKDNPRKISIYRSNYSVWNWDDEEVEFDTEPYVYTTDINLAADCRMVSNEKYQYVYYYQENKIYRWVYMASEPKLPTEPELTLDADDEITCMEMSPNREHLWVCVYNKNADTELKGKLLVVNPATMAVEKVFPGISDRAIKVMWKPIQFEE
mgnify:FL=1